MHTLLLLCHPCKCQERAGEARQCPKNSFVPIASLGAAGDHMERCSRELNGYKVITTELECLG